MHLVSLSAPLIPVGLISAAALAYEILLTRLFAIVHWHHLVAAAISLALLGYGASGTFLAILGGRLRAHFAPAFISNALLFGLSSLLCVHLTLAIPFDPQALTWDWGQLGYLAGGFLALAVPFFAAANCIGLSLWHFKKDIPRLYGADLIGAASGALILLGGLALLEPADMLFGVFIGAMLVTLVAAWRMRWRPVAVALIVLTTTGLVWLFGRPELNPAQYKDLTRSLAVLGARLVHEESGVAGVLSVVQNERVPIRVAPGLSLHAEALPPHQLAVFVDGDAAGTLSADQNDRHDSAYLGYLTSALPYALFDAPRVAVLNAATGLAVEQAISLGADSVIAVEPNPQIVALACKGPVSSSQHRCGPRVEWLVSTPRSFAARGHAPFDLITLTLGGDPAGLDALTSDYDFTREALVAYLHQLAPGGMLAIDGPTRLPPRLVSRAIDTARSALLERGAEHPERHVAVVRGWRRFMLIVAKEPLDAGATAAVETFAGARGFDLVWLPGMAPEQANRHQRLTHPLYYEQAVRILGDRPHDVHDAFRFDLEAATDDAPFPHRFTRWGEWISAVNSGERARLSQLDTGLFVSTAILLVITVGGLLLILFPLFWLHRSGSAGPGRGQQLRTLLYFGLLGVAFLFVEMAWIQRMQLFLGLPLYATAVVLIAFLAFAGLGSLWSQRLSASGARLALIAAVGTVLLASLAYVSFLPPLLGALADLPIAGRAGIILLLLAPLAFAMGIPFPSGLRRLGDSASELIPWAWGINGVMSVISAAAAPLLAMEIGFTGLTAIAVTAYLILPAIRLDPQAPN